MELSKCAGESSFAALIRPGYHEDPLRIFQIEVIRNHGSALADELVCQTQVKYLAPVNFLGPIRNCRVAEWKSGLLDALHVIQAGEVKLHLPVKRGNHAIQVTMMPAAVRFQRRKDLWIELRNQLEDGRLNMIYFE